MKKILVVDDDPSILEVVTLILTSNGFDVITHKSGYNVPYVVRNNTPDLILLDISLPEKSGIEISKELKILYSIPIILFSVSSEKRFAESKADGYINKPFDLKDLLGQVNKYLK